MVALPAAGDAGASKIVDMRSDTVTHPTPEMRAAMAAAEVGDDVFGEDPTVKKLEALGASMFGKQAALYVPTGTMANLCCLLVHCDSRMSEVIVGSQNHIYLWEVGGSAALGGIHPRAIPTLPDGTMSLDEIEGAIRMVNDHFPTTRLVALEQTQNQCGGQVLPLDYIDSVAALCRRRGLSLHVDGARIFNACAALDVDPARMVRDVDSVSVCLSKGLASPAGSLVIGGAEFVAKARRMRKALGGGMRQSGVLAACGLLSLEKMSQPSRLKEDHRRAREVASGLASVEGLEVAAPASNMVLVKVVAEGIAASDLVADLKARGTCVIALPGTGKIRVTLHCQVDDDDVKKAVADFKAAMLSLRVGSGQGSSKRQKVE
ncbi:unnamed protein product [Prorocentrum cordatum]|uniref:Aromatic amino acid beta-eliminating lyase/threonine aldolase domain-containing protein n=1 Tax=Prorocentrum cordatum TaxID=2364126 RepID=A0ABN9QZG2_9DINO|nr:unnamed protein product [Polarella glacialis]